MAATRELSSASVQTKGLAEVTTAAPVARNVAVDAYRGFVMLLMMGEILRLSQVAAAYPGSLFWRVLAYNQTHVEWAGCSLHDLIQPSFTFLVGVRFPTLLRAGSAKARSFRRMLGHTIWRSFLLMRWGFFCGRCSVRRPTTPLKTR